MPEEMDCGTFAGPPKADPSNDQLGEPTAYHYLSHLD